LNQTGLVLLRADYTEGRCANRSTWGGELHTIEEIEELGAKLQLHAFGYAGCLKNREGTCGSI
jgi:hypothetical protein